MVAHVPEARAANYALTITPGWIQESNTPGVLLFINVTGATIGTVYKFTWQVTDPSGMTHQASNQTGSGGAPSTTFTLSINYPNGPGFGTNVNFVGNYTVNVQQNNPTNIPSVATGQFKVGLTDQLTYQRTFTVSVKARGYANSSPANINISHGGTSAPGYPTILTTDPTGSLSTSWTIPANAPTGLWTVSLSGNPTKTPPDTQVFTVYPTNVTIARLSLGRAIIERTETQSFSFTANYLSGTPVQTGSTQIRVTESDGTTSFHVTANYSSTLAAYNTSYRILPQDEAGAWVANIDPSMFNDGYGNGGPATSIVRGFEVQPATLTVMVSISNQTFNVGQAMPMYATVVYPDGTPLNNGTVTATFTEVNGTRIGTPLSLTFVQGQSKWAAVYSVKSTDPSGLWLITVRASDTYGNIGQQISSSVVNVSTPPQTTSPGLPSSLFLLLAVLLGTTVGVVLVVFRRKTKTSEVKLDLRVIDKEVDRIHEGEFFRNVRKQVEESKPSSTNPQGAQRDEE